DLSRSAPCFRRLLHGLASWSGIDGPLLYCQALLGWRRMKRLPLLAVLVALASTVPAQAQSRFFEGKTIRIVVGFSPGGGYDTYSRTIARHMSRHIPGNPTIIVENMACALTKASGVTTLEQWKSAKTPVKIGAVGPGDTSHDVGRVLMATVGLADPARPRLQGHRRDPARCRVGRGRRRVLAVGVDQVD